MTLTARTAMRVAKVLVANSGNIHAAEVAAQGSTRALHLVATIQFLELFLAFLIWAHSYGRLGHGVFRKTIHIAAFLFRLLASLVLVLDLVTLCAIHLGARWTVYGDWHWLTEKSFVVAFLTRPVAKIFIKQ